MASPTATSAAATAMMKNTNTWPAASPLYAENADNNKFTELSMSSIDMNTMIALRLKRTPNTPMVKIAKLK